MLRPRSSPSAATERRLTRWSLLAAAGLLVALAGPPLAGKIYGGNDLLTLYLPLRAFCADQWARGEPADWMPGLFCGFDLTGEGEAASYHPLHRILYRFLPLTAAWNLEIFLTYPFMLAGAYLFLHGLVARRDAAVLGAVAFTFGGFNLLHFMHPGAIAVVAHLPWLLWVLRAALAHPTPRRLTGTLPAIAILTASQLLLGYPQYVFFSLLAEAALVLFLFPSPVAGEGRLPRSLCWAFLAAAKGTGLLLAGVQFLPTLDALAASARAHPGPGFQTWGSLHPLNLIQLVAPYGFSTRVWGQNTHELGAYLGAVPLVLALWAIARQKELGRLRPAAFAAAGCAIVFLLLAMGKYAPLYRVQQFLPLVNHFRFPARYIVLVQGAVAILAAIGFAELARRQGDLQPGPPQRTGMLGAVFTASVLAALAGLGLQGRPFAAGPLPILAGPLLIGAAAALVALAERRRTWALAGLVIVGAVDWGVYGLSYGVYPEAVSWDRYLAAIRRPPQADGGRVLADLWRYSEPGLRTGNQILLAGFERADGYVGLEPRRWLRLDSLAALRVAGVEWVRDGEQTRAIPGLAPAGQGWWRVPDPLPRLRLLTRAAVAPRDDRPLDLGKIDVAATAIVDEPLDLPPSNPGTARWSFYRPGRMTIRLDVPARQLLVIAESFHSGWRAEIDGRPARLQRVYGDFLGCVVDPEDRCLDLEYRPASLIRGQRATLAGLGCLGLLAALPWAIGRKAFRGRPPLAR